MKRKVSCAQSGAQLLRGLFGIRNSLLYENDKTVGNGVQYTRNNNFTTVPDESPPTKPAFQDESKYLPVLKS